MILLTAQGLSGRDIGERMDLSSEAVSRIPRRFRDGGVKRAGRSTESRPEGSRGVGGGGGANHSTRALAAAPGAQSLDDAVVRTTGPPGQQLHFSDPSSPRGQAAPDSYLEGDSGSEVRREGRGCRGFVFGPAAAIVLRLDEKTSIHAFSRIQPPLPLRTGRASRHTDDYEREGVIEVYAALEVAKGKVTHRLGESHSARDLLSFMSELVRAYPEPSLHVVLDNSSSHSTPEVNQWLPALREHIAAHMRDWNRHPTPFAWTKPARANHGFKAENA